MRWYRVTALMLVLLSLSNLSAQTISVSLESLKALREELLNSKVLLSNSEKAVIELQQSLKEAKESQVISEEKIADLETRLSEALSEQERLRNRIVFLESRLIELSASLTGIQKDLDDTIKKHIAEIIDLTSDYERRVKWYRIATWVLGSVVIGGAAYVGVQSLGK